MTWSGVRATARWTLVACALALTGGCAWEPFKPRPRKSHLVVMPPGFRPGAIAVGEPAEGWVFVVETDDGREQVYHPGKSGPTFRGIIAPQVAPRTRRVLYWARMGAAELALVVDDAVVVRGLRRNGPIVFSKDGTRWAAVARTHGDDEDARGRALAVVDGVVRGSTPDVSLPSFSADGRHVAYLEETEAGTLDLVIDGEPRTTYERPQTCAPGLEPPPDGPTLTPRVGAHYLSDGRILVVAQDREGWGIYRGETRLASYPVRALPTGQPTFGINDPCARAGVLAPTSVGIAPEAPVAAWWERPPGEERWRVVVDGRPVDDRLCFRWWEKQPPEFSPDGRHVAYPCGQPDGGILMILDGRAFGPYREVWGFTVSDDGAHVAYGGSDGSAGRPWRVYADGEPRSGRYASVWRPRFAPDGDQLAWEGEAKRNGSGVLGLDRHVLLSFDEILSGPTFEPSGEVQWVIRKGRKITRIDMPTS